MSPRRKAKIAAQINKQKHSECWKELKKEGENLRALQNRSTLVGEHKGSDGANNYRVFRPLVVNSNTWRASRYGTAPFSYHAYRNVPCSKASTAGTATVIDQNSHACYGLQSREIKKSKDSIKSTEENCWAKNKARLSTSRPRNKTKQQF